MTKNGIKFVTSSEALLHYQPFPKPNLEAFENALRLQMAEKHLIDRELLGEGNKIEAESATDADILLTHSPYLFDSVRLMADLGSGEVGDAAYASPDLIQSALFTVGGAIQAAKIATTDDDTNAFSLMRPPGHHASTSNPMGLCYFNNVAIAVAYARKHLDISRVTIIDFDDHHGNGTSEIFYAEPDVQYISIHEYDYENFGLGHYEEIGYGKAEGTNINIPFVMSSSDESYRLAFDKIIVPFVKRFKPDLIAVSAGYDAHYGDPVGNMDIDSSTYWHIGKCIKNLVDTTPAIGSFWVLEGGYNPFILGTSIEASILGLIGEPLPKLDDQLDREVQESIIEANEDVIEGVIETHSQFA
jgi:acetoin utilization deacetylase AcuC-like enzyme